MPKTLTPRGVQKIAELIAGSVDHAAYTLDGAPKTVPILRTTVAEDTLGIYVYFDDSVAGTIAEVTLIDRDGDVIAQRDGEVQKPPDKGFYVLFRYRITEQEVETDADL